MQVPRFGRIYCWFLAALGVHTRIRDVVFDQKSYLFVIPIWEGMV